MLKIPPHFVPYVSMTAGHHEIEVNGQDLSSGVYLYWIETGDWQDVKKIVYLK